MKAILSLMLVAVIVLCGGCAVNRTLTYNKTNLGFGYSNLNRVLLAVQEGRDQVRISHQKPSWCGRNSIYNIQTESGKPLSDEFSNAIWKSMTQAGNAVEQVTVGMNVETDSLLRMFSKRPENRLVLITINNWETNCTALWSTMRYEVISKLTVNVYDKSGKLMAVEEVSDSKTREQGAGLNMKVLQALSDTVLEEQIHKLFNKESVKSSLQQASLQ